MFNDAYDLEVQYIIYYIYSPVRLEKKSVFSLTWLVFSFLLKSTIQYNLYYDMLY